MNNIIKLLFFTVCFLVAQYSVGEDDCVRHGLNNEITSINVEIPVHKSSDDLQIYWVDSGEVISRTNVKNKGTADENAEDKDKVRFTIDGSIDLCPTNNESKTLVPATFCDNDSVPDYSKAENIEKAPDDLGYELDGVCSGVRDKDSKREYGKRRYVDTGIKVNPGDKLIFSLIPRKIKITCNNYDQGNSVSERITFDEIKNSDSISMNPKEICQGKVDCSGESSNKEPKSLDGSYDVLVGNGYTPYDNKVYRSLKASQWMKGSLLDLRRCDRERTLTELKESLLNPSIMDKIYRSCDNNNDRQRCIREYEEAELKKEKEKYSVYELNCFENKICYNASGIGTDCVSSIRYQKYDKNNRCDMDAYITELRTKIEEMRGKGNDSGIVGSWDNGQTNDISWAESLVAKIVSSSDPIVSSLSLKELPHESQEELLHESKGSQCFPKKSNGRCALIESDNFKDFSLQLNHEYVVGKDDRNEKVEVAGKSAVMLAIASQEKDDHPFYRGGYYVETRKSCKFEGGEKLHLYIGNSPPKKIGEKDVEGISDTGMLYSLGPGMEPDVSGVLSKDGDIYTIDKSKLKVDGNNKIYFGIDVRNVVKNTLRSNDIHNKYIVNLSVERRVNNYVSSLVDGIFKYIKDTMIKKDNLENMYAGLAKGLLSSIRVLLVVYIVFSVMGYMLGMVECGMNDFIIRVIKIAVVVFVLSEKSWEFFGENLYTWFIDGSRELINGFAGYGDKRGGTTFGFLDETVGVLFSLETWLKFLSLMIAGPFGFIAFLGIIWASVVFLKCMMIAIVRYIIATVLVGFLLTLAPLFIVCILFQVTSKLFTGWIKIMATVSLQPVIAFSLLSLLSKLLYPIFYNITNFSACYECLFKLDFPGYDICIIKAIWPSGYDPSVSVEASYDMGATVGSLPIDIIQALIYFIFANVIDNFIGMSEAISESVFSGSLALRYVPGVASSASNAVLSAVGLDRGTQGSISSIRKTPHSSVLANTGQTSPNLNVSRKGAGVDKGGRAEGVADADNKDLIRIDRKKE
jgi:type IV secretion system protein VirB6